MNRNNFRSFEKFHTLKLLFWAVAFLVFAVLVFIFRIVYENNLSKQSTQSYLATSTPPATPAINNQVTPPKDATSSPEVKDVAPQNTQVLILDTPTGWLNVRSGPTTTETIVGKVNPGETYDLIQEKDSWYKIHFAGQEGWITSQYAKKQ